MDIPVDKNCTVLELAIKKHLPIEHSCGGSGSCGTCHVFIKSGLEKLGPKNELEQSMDEDRGFAPNERLACQIHPVEGLVVEIPHSEDSEDFR